MVKLIRNYFTVGEVIGQIEELPSDSYWIKYLVPYVTLYYGDTFIFCLDNDSQYMDDIIEKIERRAGKRIETIPYSEKGDPMCYRFKQGGWKYDNWVERFKKVSYKGRKELK